ncbi:MAG: hypothetical protein JWN44_5883 [Myxococcales bacterium]|nr:hypothetical protein [Myxococcales bacterium]
MALRRRGFSDEVDDTVARSYARICPTGARRVDYVAAVATTVKKPHTPVRLVSDRFVSPKEFAVLMILLIVLLVLALGGGGMGYSRYGFAGMSPAALLLIILVILYFTGHLHTR